MLTPEKYEKLKVLVTSNSDISEETLAKADAAMREYESQPENDPAVQGLMQQLDPSMPIAPQVLATQPGTTHPGGDEGAESEWLSGPLDNPAGRVIVYDAPAAVVRQRLLENPQLGKTLTGGRALTPEEIAVIQPGDSLYQGFNDLEWNDVSKKAGAAGKTAYRHSKAPYLDGGPNAGWLDTLSTKLKASAMPALETLSAFVMGLDNSASFGAGQAAANAGAGSEPLQSHGLTPLTPEEEASGKWAMHPTLGKIPKEWEKKTVVGTAIGGGNDEVVGGVFQTAAPDLGPQEVNDRLKEESPIADVAGEVTGAFLPTGASSKLFDLTLGAASKLAPAGAGLGKRALAGALGLGAGGAVTQAGSEAVDAVATGGASLEGAGGRVAEAAGDSLMFGSPFAAIQGLAKAGGGWTREGRRYKGLPGQAEKLNEGKVELGRGHIDPPDVKAARAEGKARKMEVGPVDVIAEKLDEPIRAAGSKLVSDVESAGAKNAAAHYGSAEGKVTLQANNTVRASLERMRKLTSDVAGDRRAPVGKAGADNPLKGIFNASIENVTTKPSKSGVPLPLKEAKAFLSPEWQKKVKLAALEEKGVSRVYVTPRRLDSEHADEVIRQLGDSADEDVKAVLEAARSDRDGRAWNGLKGGWSKVQEQQAKGAAKAKDVQKLAGGDEPGGAYKAVVKASTPHKGESRSLAAIDELAKRSDAAAPKPYGPASRAPGPSERLFNSARAAGIMDELRGWSSLGKSPSGLDRGRTAAVFDAAVLRGAYPVSRKVEKAGDWRKAGKAGAVNSDDEAHEKRTAEREEPKVRAAKERAAAEPEPKTKRKRRSMKWLREEMNQ